MGETEKWSFIFGFWSRRACVLACATRGGGQSEAGHCFHLLSFFFLSFFFFFFFFSAFYFSPTSENLPCVKICFPQYFGITRRYMHKINIFLGKKADFRARFRNGQRSVTEPGPTPSPWSIWKVPQTTKYWGYLIICTMLPAGAC